MTIAQACPKMTEVTAEMIERGRGADPKVAAERRRLAVKVREAREKLTSTETGHRAFDLQLLQLFAEGRKSSGLIMSAFILAIAAITTAWIPLLFSLGWLFLTAAGMALSYRWAAKFPEDASAETDISRWRHKFIFAETLQGLIWAGLASFLGQVDAPGAETFALVLLLLVSAMNTPITASIPNAVIGSLVPTTLAIFAVLRPTEFGDRTFFLTALACGMQLYFLVLANKLYQTTLNSLSFQAEKDQLITELEQARINSDVARRRSEEANLAKSRFLATMSHELRTPLNAILGFSEDMKGELFGVHNVPAYKEYSNDIHSSGEHLLMLINEILDLSRVEAGRYELREESIALVNIVEDCRHLLTLRAKKRNITVTEAFEPQLPRMWADERAVRQVALNLLSNAIKFTPQGGAITIKVGWTAAGGQYFSVRDTGPGIPEDEIPVVMSSFGRGSFAQKNAEEGSGLGLPIVKGLVELHGGTFILKSKVREGTEVIVVFPPERIMNALPRLDPSKPAPSAQPRSAQKSARATRTAA
jgi:two-component system cell cycle sensor histidine kinase PleC